MLEDTKDVNRSRNSKKDRQSDCLKEKEKRTNNDLQITKQETKDWVTRTWDDIRWKGSCACSWSDTHREIEQQGHGMISDERVAVPAEVTLLLLLIYEFTVDRKDCQ